VPVRRSAIFRSSSSVGWRIIFELDFSPCPLLPAGFAWLTLLDDFRNGLIRAA